MISHQEAEVLTSARQDAPLDPIVERELQAHLATCDQCRSFAAATERLTAGMRALPAIPANPRIKREVMGRVRAGRGPFAGLLGGIGSGFQPGPALAALALVAVIGLFGWFALDRLFVGDGDNDSNNQVAAVPTMEITRELAASTPTLEATDTPPTETPAPTSTVVPVPTETAAPTDEPVPTATTPAEPTATTVPVPTATSVPAPTVTPQPTAEPTIVEAPVDLTSGGERTTTLRTTVTPTNEPEVVPTATEAPTPTSTEEVLPTAEPTSLPEPTPTPAIEPMDGATSEPVVTAQPDGSGNAGDGETESADTIAPIEPTGGDVATSDVTPDGSVDSTGGSKSTAAGIELIDPNGDVANGETTPEAAIGTTGQTADAPVAQPLADVSERYSGIIGDPSGLLGLTNEGRLEFVTVPDGASMTTAEGYRMQMADVQPGVVQLCGDGFCEPGMSAPEGEGWQGDVPMGVVDNTAYLLRMFGDRSELYAAQPQGTQLVEANLIAELGPTSPPAAVYESGGTLYTWLPSGQWLEISGGSAQVLSGSLPNPTNVRLAPSAEGGPLLGYFSNGTLVVAPVAAPDSALLSIPADGVDFDISPPGNQVAVIRGNSIVIYDMQGNELAFYEGGEMQPGSLIWLRGGLVWVDRATGSLYSIPETAP